MLPVPTAQSRRGKRGAITDLSVHRNNPIIQSWHVKAGSNLLSGTATLPVEKVFLAEVMPASPKDNDIALVKLQSPLRVSGETWHTPP